MSLLLFAVRYVLPGAAVLAGLVVLGLGGGSALDGGLSLITAGAAIYLMNWFYRTSIDEPERQQEIRAREFYSRYGFWPDEEPPHRGP
ncbi:MAG: hypothetical protein NVSMB51_14310 [Solirubrobacteraceae bacterium]